MIDDFLKYEFDLGSQFLIPLLEKLKISLDDKSVLDVGCGYGGVLSALQNKFKLGKNLGIDVDGEMIHAGLDQNTASMNQGFTSATHSQGHGIPRDLNLKLNLKVGNFFDFHNSGEDGGGKEKFDFILMRDVLEHIVDVEKALLHAASLLKPGGYIFVSFAPYILLYVTKFFAVNAFSFSNTSRSTSKLGCCICGLAQTSKFFSFEFV